MASYRHSLGKAFYRIKEEIAQGLYPEECIFCHKEGPYLCVECEEYFSLSPVNSCPFCHKFSFLGRTCSACRAVHYLDGVFSFGSYQNYFLQELIKSLKYESVRSLSWWGGKMLGKVLANVDQGQRLGCLPRLFTEKALFFSVPLHFWRFHYRGFNQAEELLKALIKQKTIFAYQANQNEFLKRKKFTFPQAKLTEKERKKNLKNAFSFSGHLNKQTVFIIDDVSTTGSTLDEVAKTLKQAGARRVYGLVLAAG